MTFRRGEMGKGDYWCGGCKKFRSETYIQACDECVYLDVVQISPTTQRITPRRGTGDGELVRVLFLELDRWFEDGHWYVTNLPNYAHLKCVQVASLSYLKQYSFI